MELDPNFSEFIELLHAREVRFLVVGGYAVAFHGHPRYTADLDIWRPFISLADLRRNKEAAGRAQDVADLEALPDPGAA